MTSRSDNIEGKEPAVFAVRTAEEAGKKDIDALRRLQVRDEQDGG
jgi:hypothetical protein